jgi:hypothetical protein
MKTGTWTYDGARQIITGEISYTITDPVTGETIDRTAQIEVPEADIDLTGVKNFADVTAKVAAALSPKTASRGAVEAVSAAAVIG